MSEVRTEKLSVSALILSKMKDYGQLAKFRLSSLVVFSSLIGYLFAANGGWEWSQLILFLTGGFLVTASSNALNQVIEKEFDRLMNRTMKRPLPDERMSVMEALLTAGVFGVGGITIFLVYFNQLSAILSALALLTYAFIYTPLKRFSPIAVFVGALPGALPPLIGIVSAAGSITTLGLSLFAIQFLWQFPHFWAVAWVAYDDYVRAGYHLLPSRSGRTKFSALQTVFYIIALIPVSLVPAWFGFTGVVSAVVVLLCGLVFLFQALNLFRECTVPAARKLMFGSFFYLPVVLLALYLDRI
ncbi:MAG: protoheme IX farnesyltransferase [Bacteroidetes bacterium]|nr:protoheme IX farnesyltransferase [Bacteroidota bacterium]